MSELDEVTVGVVGRAHGIKGEVVIDVRTDEVERRFTPGAVLYTEQGQTLGLAATRWVSGRLLARFDEVADRTAAENLRETVLSVRVPADEVPSGAEEYFDRQLIGLQVFDSDGKLAGSITEVLHGPVQDLLVVDTGGVERLVPFVTELVPVVDLDGGRVQLAEVGGLLDEIGDD